MIRTCNRFVCAVLALTAPFLLQAQPQVDGLGKYVGNVTYYGLIRNAYGDKLQHVLELKARYRSAHPELEVITNYSKMHDLVPVCLIEDKPGWGGWPSVNLGINMDARAGYFPVMHTIVTKDRSVHVLRHEAGHSMQDLGLTAMDQTDSFIRVMLEGWPASPQGEDYLEARMIGYVLCQSELEVRLAALNRCMYVERNELILTPRNALRALATINSAPTYRQCAGCFLRHGEVLSLADYNDLTNTWPMSVAWLNDNNYQDIASLAVVIRSIASSNVPRDYLDRLMDKMLMELPAHA
jgi:hypothetical protein